MAHKAPGLPELHPVGHKRNSGSEQRRALHVVVFALVSVVLLWSDFSKLSQSLNILHSSGSIYREGSLSLKVNVDLCPTKQDTC